MRDSNEQMIFSLIQVTAYSVKQFVFSKAYYVLLLQLLKLFEIEQLTFRNLWNEISEKLSRKHLGNYLGKFAAIKPYCGQFVNKAHAGQWNFPILICSSNSN